MSDILLTAAARWERKVVRSWNRAAAETSTRRFARGNQNKENMTTSSVWHGRPLFLSQPLNSPVEVVEDIGVKTQFR